MNKHPSDGDYVCISTQEVAAFLRSCYGIPPVHWYSRERTSLFANINALEFCRILVHSPANYEQHLAPMIQRSLPSSQTSSERLWPNFFQLIVSAAFYDPSLMQAYHWAYTLTLGKDAKKKLTGNAVAHALAYVILTRNHDGFASNW